MYICMHVNIYIYMYIIFCTYYKVTFSWISGTVFSVQDGDSRMAHMAEESAFVQAFGRFFGRQSQTPLAATFVRFRPAFARFLRPSSRSSQVPWRPAAAASITGLSLVVQQRRVWGQVHFLGVLIVRALLTILGL